MNGLDQAVESISQKLFFFDFFFLPFFSFSGTSFAKLVTKLKETDKLIRTLGVHELPFPRDDEFKSVSDVLREPHTPVSAWLPMIVETG